MDREILTRALEPGADCLSVEQLGEYADDTLAADARRRAAAHIDTCLNCRAELALLQGMIEAPVVGDERAVVSAAVAQLQKRELPFPHVHHEEPARRWWIPFGALRGTLSATAALLAMVSGYYLLSSHAPRLPTDVGSDTAVTRSLAVQVRGPVGDQVAAPERLEWREVAGAVRYHVRMMEVDRAEVWSADTTATMVELPSTVRARIDPAKTLLWQVSAFGTGPAPMAESELQRFRLAQ